MARKDKAPLSPAEEAVNRILRRWLGDPRCPANEFYTEAREIVNEISGSGLRRPLVRCSGCRFWCALAHECRRHPPQWVGTRDGWLPRWPNTNNDGWCGEGEPKTGKDVEPPGERASKR